MDNNFNLLQPDPAANRYNIVTDTSTPAFATGPSIQNNSIPSFATPINRYNTVADGPPKPVAKTVPAPGPTFTGDLAKFNGQSISQVDPTNIKANIQPDQNRYGETSPGVPLTTDNSNGQGGMGFPTITHLPGEGIPFLGKFVSAGKDITNTVSSAVNNEANNIMDLVDSWSPDNNNPNKISERTGTALNTAASTLNLIPGWLAFSATLKGAGDLPVVGPLAHVVSNVFGGIGAGATKISDAAVNALPISDQAKNNLRPALGQFSALASQFLTAALVHGTGSDVQARFNDAVETGGEKLANGLPLNPAEKIALDINDVRSMIKTQFTSGYQDYKNFVQNPTATQGGFVKIPGTGPTPVEPTAPETPTEPTVTPLTEPTPADVQNPGEQTPSEASTPSQASLFGGDKPSAPPEAPTAPEDSSTPKNPVTHPDLKIMGDTEAEKIQSAVRNSEYVKNAIATRGQDAYKSAIGSGFLNSGLSEHDIRLAEGYSQGIPIDKLATQADNPAQFTKFMTKATDYYNFRHAVDTTVAGGSTPYRENYLPQQWDLSKPEDLAKFNEIAAKKGLKPYQGFASQDRVLESYPHGESLGFKRLNPNILGDLKTDYTKAASSISQQVLKKGLAEAAPGKVTLRGNEYTAEGKPITNAQGLNGIGYPKDIADQLKGYNDPTGKDMYKMAKERSQEAGTGTLGTLKNLPKTGREAGISDGLLATYDHASTALKRVIYNLGLFHSQNIGLNYLGASILHPIQSIKGAAESVPAFFSQKYADNVIERSKNDIIPGRNMSVYDAGLRSGQHMGTELPLTGTQRLNPLKGSTAAMFDRQLPVLRYYLNKMSFGNGKIDPSSPEGGDLGKTIDKIMGEINPRTMNMNPNTMKVLGRFLGTPNFTMSKWSNLGDAAFKWGAKGDRLFGDPAGNLARTSVLGKRVWQATVGLLIGTLATGQFPNLQNILSRYIVNPTAPSNLKNSKGQSEDIAFPKDNITEAENAISNPGNYILQRENPLLRNVSEALPLSPITGRNYYGAPIQNPKSNSSWLSQYAKGSISSDLPIGIQNVMNQAEGKQGTAQTLLQLGGFSTPIHKGATSAVNRYNIR